ncbi:MAG: hypothetical protein KBG11_04180 [Bacteroidia bacterium]|nr:hypothetical protein [Bacteroidia bacterium]
MKIYFTCLLFVLGMLFACNSNQNSYSTSHVNVDTLIAKYVKEGYGMLDSNKTELLKPFLDSLYYNQFKDNIHFKIERLALLAGTAFHKWNDFELSDKYNDSLLALLADFPNQYQNHIIAALFTKGRVEFQKKNFDKAFSYYYKGKLLVDSLGDYCMRHLYHNTIVTLLYQQGRYNDAIYQIKQQSIDETKCNRDSANVLSRQRSNLSNIAICFERLNQLDSAIIYTDSAIKLFHFTYNNFGSIMEEKLYGLLLGNKGGVYILQKKYIQAEEALKESIRINTKPGYENADATLTKIKLATLYLYTNRINECNRLISDVKHDIKEQAVSHLAEQRLAKLNYEYNLQTNNLKAAIAYQDEYYALADSLKLNSAYSINSHKDFLQEFNNLETSYELKLLKEKNALKNKFLLYSILTAIMGVLIVALLLRRRLQNNKHINELTELNKRINDSNDKLKSSLNSLQSIQQENVQMMKVVAHDLRSPIAGIVSLVRLMQYDDLSPEEMKEYVGMVEKAGDNALEFIEDLLEMNRSHTNLEKKAVSVKKLLEYCVHIMQSQAIKKQQTLTLTAVDNEILINEEKIIRVINNLVSNAIKFSRPNSEIIIRAVQSTPQTVQISVKDNGIGIPDNIKEKLFNMYSGAGRSGTSGEQSYGLGLAITKQIIDAHKGRIWFNSAEGLGSHFYIELPVA